MPGMNVTETYLHRLETDNAYTRDVYLSKEDKEDFATLFLNVIQGGCNVFSKINNVWGDEEKILHAAAIQAMLESKYEHDTGGLKTAESICSAILMPKHERGKIMQQLIYDNQSRYFPEWYIQTYTDKHIIERATTFMLLEVQYTDISNRSTLHNRAILLKWAAMDETDPIRQGIIREIVLQEQMFFPGWFIKKYNPDYVPDYQHDEDNACNVNDW